jgi:hypothetical protein
LSHIDDGSLELYALGRVSQFEVVALEEHLLVCPYCTERLASVADFATAARDAALIMTTDLVATHRTNDGPVHLYVRRTSVNAWLATIRGETLGGGVAATTRDEAVDLCLRSFAEMFPEHQCGRGCRISR